MSRTVPGGERPRLARRDALSQSLGWPARQAYGKSAEPCGRAPSLRDGRRARRHSASPLPCCASPVEVPAGGAAAARRRAVMRSRAPCRAAVAPFARCRQRPSAATTFARAGSRRREGRATGRPRARRAAASLLAAPLRPGEQELLSQRRLRAANSARSVAAAAAAAAALAALAGAAAPEGGSAALWHERRASSIVSRAVWSHSALPPAITAVPQMAGPARSGLSFFSAGSSG